MQTIIDWLKQTYLVVKNYLQNNLLMLLIFSSLSIIVLFFIISTISSTFSYNSVVGKKFKKFDIIIRKNQINEDREMFLKQFNKELVRKNKTFGTVWDKFVKDPKESAGMVFDKANIKSKKFSFFNFYLIFSLIFSFCLVAIILSVKKYNFKGDNSIYILTIVPIFIITLVCMFNLIYTASRKTVMKKCDEHIAFFIQNVDEAIKGFNKNDFYLTNGKKLFGNAFENRNVISYEDYKKSESGENSTFDNKKIEEMAQEQLSDKIVKNSLNKIKDKKKVDAEPQIEEDNPANQQQEKIKSELLESLEKLKNLDAKAQNKTNNISTSKTFELEEDDVEDAVDVNLEELIKAKKESFIKNEFVKKPMVSKGAPVMNSTKKLTKPKNAKSINEALSELLEITKKSKIKKSDD